MDEILGTILNKDFFITIFGVVFTVVYAATASFILKRLRERRAERKDSFYEVLLEALSNNTIESPDDLINVYKGVTNLSTDDLSYRYGLNKWLREFLSKLLGRKIGKELSTDQLKEIKKRITGFIAYNEQVSPFSDLPDTERNILSDINSYALNDDKDSIQRKTKELSSVIQTRYEEQKKLESQNKWSIPLAVIGLILTIVFGIISLYR